MTPPVPARDGYIAFRGYRTWYRIMGEPADLPGRRPLVLLHGGPGVPWPDRFGLLDEFASSGRPVMLYHQLGCGHSDWPDNPSLWTVELFVEELQTLRHALALDSVHLFGLSWGGMLALEYALTQPDGLLSMTLMGTLADVPLYAEEAKRLREGLPAYTRQTMARMEARWRPPPEQGSGKLRAGRTPRQMRRDAHIMRGFIPLLAARPVQRVAAIASAVPGLERLAYETARIEWNRRHFILTFPPPLAVLECIAGTNPQVFETMWGPDDPLPLAARLRNWSVAGRLSQIQVPTLVINGRHDEVTPRQAAVLADGLPHARREIFEHSAHAVMVDEPEAFLAAILGFLDELDPEEPRAAPDLAG